MAQDDVLVALERVAAALEENNRQNRIASSRCKSVAKQRAKGRSYREIVAEEDRPLIVEMLTGNLDRLLAAGAELRRAQARALHNEGATMEEIAKLFGVTRQRISALLRQS